MENEPKVPAPVTDAPVVEPKVEVVPPVEKPLTLDELKAENERLARHAKNKEEEAARNFKKLEAFEKAEQAKKDAELSDLEKEKKRVAELAEENKQLKTNSLKQSIANKLGLPESLALRLQGETPEEIEKDAKEILETLPRKTAVTNPTNPGGGLQATETDAERRKRLNI
jgi:predicted  nucleic acid-binding Zn-ribbon protein